MQVNVKDLACIPWANHLELVFMTVLILQSFLAVSPLGQILAVSIVPSFLVVLDFSEFLNCTFGAVSTVLEFVLPSHIYTFYPSESWLKLLLYLLPAI